MIRVDAGKSTKSGVKLSITLLLALTVLFPEVGLIPFSDVQPNFFILSVICVVVFANKLKLGSITAVYFTVCMLCLWLSFVIHNENINWLYIFKYSISLLSFFLCYILCLNRVLFATNKLLVVTIFIYLLVAAVQFIVPDFLTFLVSRSQTQTTLDLISSGRGMMSLTGEPSHFGKTITILNVLYVFNSLMGDNRDVKHRSLLVFTIVLFVLNCLLSRSLYACFFHFVCLIGIFYILDRRATCFFIVLMAFGLTSSIALIGTMFPTVRIAQLASQAISNPELLLEQGAIVRVLNVPLTFINLSYFGFWGSGNSSLNLQSQFGTGFGTLTYTMSNRLYGGFVEYILKMGLLSLPLVTGYFYMLLTIGKVNLFLSDSRRSVGMVFSGMLFLLSLQDGSLASPLMIFTVVYMFLQGKVMLKGTRRGNLQQGFIGNNVS